MGHMMLRVIVFLNLILFLNPVFSKEIPVIVISPGKTIQSKSIVGSDITVVNDQQINEANDQPPGFACCAPLAPLFRQQ